MSWNQAATDRAKVLFAENLSMSQIARRLNEEFQTSFSRNAVIGKLHRVGCYCPPGTKSARARQAQPVRPRRHRIAFGKSSSGAQLKPAAIPVPHAPSLEFKVGFFDLTAKRCHFPLWGEDDPPLHEKFYCGAPGADIDAGIPYCPFHERHTHNGFPQR